VKKDVRLINTIEEVKKIGTASFSITYQEKTQKKVINYECYNGDNCSEILAKLNFLRNNFDKPLSLNKNLSS